MRGNGDICIFCRHAISLRSSSHAAKRHASTRRPEPYVLPRLVIDLDAADSKYVRKVEKLEEWHPQSPKKSSDPLRRQRHRPWYRRRSDLPFDICQVTPPDLLTFALLGDPSRGIGSNWRTQNLGNIYHYRGIQTSYPTRIKALHLSSNFVLDQTERLKQAGFTEDKEKANLWQLIKSAERQGFPELARMVSMISSTREGCIFLDKKHFTIRTAIQYCRKSQTAGNPWKVITSDKPLVLLNNLRINMESKDYRMGLSVCTALHYASKSWNLPSIRMYLGMMSEYRLKGNWGANKYSLPVLGSLASLVLRLLYEPEKAASLEGLEASKLITGWDHSKPAIRTRMKASFMSVLEHSQTFGLCSTYLASLAEMQLRDTLVVEWQIDPKHAIGKQLWKQDSKLRAQVFALAFQLAGDSDYALSILQSMPKDQPSETNSESLQTFSQPSETATEHVHTSDWGALRGDIAANEKTESLPKHVQLLLEFFERHYYYHNLRTEKVLREKLIETLQDLPNDPHEFLSTFEKFMVRGYRAPIISSSLSPKQLRWMDENGVRGLLVLSEEDIPLYWKPASEALS